MNNLPAPHSAEHKPPGVIREELKFFSTGASGIISLLSGILGIAPFVWQMGGGTAAIAMIGGGLVSASIVLNWRLLKRIKELRSNSTYSVYFDREYLRFKGYWSYSLGKDDTWDATYVGERELICLDEELTHLTVSFERDESISPFRPGEQYQLQLIEHRRDRNGVIEPGKPYKKSGGSFAVNINFYPPLAQGERAFVHFKIQIPHYTCAFSEQLQELSTLSQLGMRDYDFNSIRIQFPIRELEYHVFLPKVCRATPLGIEVQRRQGQFTSEKNHLVKEGLYQVEQREDGWHMLLKRKNPPLHSRYRLKWRPPAKGS